MAVTRKNYIAVEHVDSPVSPIPESTVAPEDTTDPVAASAGEGPVVDIAVAVTTDTQTEGDDDLDDDDECERASLVTTPAPTQRRKTSHHLGGVDSGLFSHIFRNQE